jgi:hypothetical protein
MSSFKTIFPHFSATVHTANNVSRIAKSLLMLVVLAGCRDYKISQSEPAYSYLNPYRNLISIGRVAIIELDNNSAFPKISVDTTEAIFLALQKKQIFGLTLVRQDNADWSSLRIKPDSVHSLEQLFTIRETLKCNALLVGTVTQYEPYPHMVIGLRIRLLDLSNGQLLWAVEQVWDSADLATKRRIRHYFQNQIPWSAESLQEQMTVISPLEFVRFVAYETAETLQTGEKNDNIGFSGRGL